MFAMSPKIVNENEIRQLLRQDVERSGGQSAWARRERVCRTHLNRMLLGKRAVSDTILRKLNIKAFYVDEND